MTTVTVVDPYVGEQSALTPVWLGPPEARCAGWKTDGAFLVPWSTSPLRSNGPGWATPFGWAGGAWEKCEQTSAHQALLDALLLDGYEVAK